MTDALKHWYLQGLQALASADEIGRKGAEEGAYKSQNGEVVRLAEESAQMQARHAQVIADLLKAAGEEPGRRDNPAMTGIYKAIDQMIEGAEGEVKDAAALAGSQLAFHYYIAAYGSLAASAKHAGENDAVSRIKQMSEEVKAQDEKYTSAAQAITNPQVASA